MKLTVDPMPALRLTAAGKVNARFDSLARSHRDAAHALKRDVAKAGAPYPDWFTQEARLRGITSQALATIILSKPVLLAERELQRQRVMALIDVAQTPAELDAIFAELK